MNNEYVFAHLTVIILVAALSGALLAKLKQPVIIGYILAGVVFGPSGYSYISSQDQVQFYSELGIVLLLFVIGMELNIKSFIKMWKIPTFFTVIQVSTNALIAIFISDFFDLPIYISLLVAFIVSLSSTAAIVKVLEHMEELRTDVGYISIGILVAQDIAIVPMMLVMKQYGKEVGASMLIDLVIAICLVIVTIKYLGKNNKIKIPMLSFISNSDLAPVVTLGLCFAASSLVVLLGLSEAYGAFLAGLFIGNTEERQHILNSIKPIQNVLLMAFFLSVGLMFDLHFLAEEWPMVFATLFLVTIWKIVSNTAILRMFSVELAKATSIGIILAQLGEFALILANVAISSKIIDSYGQKFIVCITAMSLSIGPLLISLATKTRNLSFVGDNSIFSIVKVLSSIKFSKEVKKLSIENAKLKHKNTP
jgi:CPA2 family monovalent cation:H+ antiporter-2